MTLILGDRYTQQQKLGKLIMLARLAEDLTQTQLAERLNICQDSISRFERGQTVPDFLMMMAIASTLNQELEYFRV